MFQERKESFEILKEHYICRVRDMHVNKRNLFSLLKVFLILGQDVILCAGYLVLSHKIISLV